MTEREDKLRKEWRDAEIRCPFCGGATIWVDTIDRDPSVGTPEGFTVAACMTHGEITFSDEGSVLDEMGWNKIARWDFEKFYGKEE